MTTPPVLVLGFNRPEKTRQVISQLRKAKPKQVFFSTDGPRLTNRQDQEKSSQVRNLRSDFDWDCQLHENHNERNLGCQRAVEEGISWFLKHVECGIILEDDCVPDLSFFPYCAELLERYKSDNRIMMISGFNPIPDIHSKESYRFSSIAKVWGWATWRRSWNLYDKDFSRSPDIRNDPILHRLFEDPNLIAAWKYRWGLTQLKKVDSWAWRWAFSMMTNSGLCVTPNSNLIRNVGFDEDATHTSEEWKGPCVQPIGTPLIHPTKVFVDKQQDMLEERNVYPVGLANGIWGLWKRFRKRRRLNIKSSKLRKT